MTVEFRCKRSGNTVSFSNEDDIAQMRKHEGYDEVKREEIVEVPQFLRYDDVEKPRRGRPKTKV